MIVQNHRAMAAFAVIVGLMGALAADCIAYGEPRSLSDGRLVAADRATLVVTT